MGGPGIVSKPMPVLYPLCPTTAIVILSSSVFSSYRHSRRLYSVPARRHVSIACTSKQAVLLRKPSLQSKNLTDAIPSPGSGSGSGPLVWPEWVQLVEFLTEKGYIDKAGSVVNELKENGDLSEEFLKVSQALILFSEEIPERIRSLPRNHMKVVVENSYPHLFKNGESSSFRLKCFLNGSEANGVHGEVAKTIDLVRYVLSYISIDNNANEIIDESMKYLLVYLVNRNWICPKCKYMISTSIKECFKCTESEYNIISTAEEWECPQCNFSNRGTNISCSGCDFIKLSEFTKKPSFPEEILKEPDSVPLAPLPANEIENRNSNSMDLDAKSEPLNEEELLDAMHAKKEENRSVARNKTENNSLKYAEKKYNVVPFVPFPPEYFPERQNKENSYKLLASLYRGGQNSLKYANWNSYPSQDNSSSDFIPEKQEEENSCSSRDNIFSDFFLEKRENENSYSSQENNFADFFPKKQEKDSSYSSEDDTFSRFFPKKQGKDDDSPSSKDDSFSAFFPKREAYFDLLDNEECYDISDGEEEPESWNGYSAEDTALLKSVAPEIFNGKKRVSKGRRGKRRN